MYELWAMKVLEMDYIILYSKFFDEIGISMAESSDSSRFLLTSESGQLYQIGIANNIKGLEGIALTIETTRDQIPAEVQYLINNHRFKIFKEVYNL